MESKTFDVFGMTCAACQANVTKAVSKLEGVSSVDVSLLSNSMKVEFDANKVTPAQIEQSVSAVGYEAVLKNQTLHESGEDEIAQEWQQRQKRTEKEMKEKKSALVYSIVLLIPLLCIAMGPHIGVFTELMDMEWAMVSSLLQLILTMFILFFQRQFFIHGLKALIKRAPNMDSLVAIGSGAAYIYGVYMILRMAYGYGVMNHEIIHTSAHSLYFESAATIVTLVSLGKYLEAKSKAKTSDALGKLVDLAPKSALIEKDGVQIEVASSQIVSGDIVVMKPGARVPVDGIVLSGTGYVDQSAITGESIPVEKQAGDPVISATMNINGTFRFEATKVGADTTLAQIIRLVDEAGNSKAPIARLADRVSGVFVPVVIGIALVCAIVWLILGAGFEFALSCAISVLVISCPCALGLATPVAIMVSTGKAAEYGILVKSAASLESLHSINAIVLDKTGTITSGKPSVQKMVLYDASLNQNSFLALAASLELGSEHPLGKAIVQKAQEQGLELQECSSFEALGGKGLKATLNGVQYLAGNQKLMEEEGVALNAKEKEKIDNLAMLGMTPLLFASNKQLIGIICVADTIRSTSEQALALLSEKGIKTIMLTGDNTQTAKAIASKLKIDEVIADVLPAQKENVIRTLQAQGYKVAMVGDGINDAPALSRAEVGIAIGAGTDIAIESADIVLMKDNLLDVNTAIDLSNATIRNIKQNLFWAFFYNTLGIPVAAGLLYPAFGITLSPMIGSLAMSLSSVCVVSNALRLRFFKPKDETKPEMQSQIESRQAQMEFEQLEQDIEKQAVPPVKIYEIGVGGMSCQHCAARVQKALLALPGVLAAQVNLNSESARIEANEQVEESSLKEAIEKAGYIPQERKTQTMKKEMKVGGMSCQHCAKHVKDALSAIDGVEDVEVNLPEGKAVFTETKPVASEKLIQAIEDAGYEPGEVTAI